MKNLKNLVNDAESGVKDIQDSVIATFSERELAKVLGVVLIGVAVGAIIGVLFAPNRGVETRRTIADSMKNLGNTVADKAKQSTSKLSELKDQAVDTVKSKIGATNTPEPSFANSGKREASSFNEP